MNDLLKISCLSCIFMLTSCLSESEDSNKGLIKENITFGDCKSYVLENGKANVNKEIVIRTPEEYSSYLKEMGLDSFTCKTIPKIEFNKYSLIGKGVVANGKDVAYNRNFYSNGNGKFKYVIEVLHKENVESQIFSMNYVLVPHLEKDAQVEFEIK
ncbi:MAG: hypothetical protein ACHQIM_02560 [Sphingobacteriales bacterium]